MPNPAVNRTLREKPRKAGYLHVRPHQLRVAFIAGTKYHGAKSKEARRVVAV